MLSQKKVDVQAVFLILLPALKTIVQSFNFKKTLLVSLIKEEIGYEFAYSTFARMYNKYLKNKETDSISKNKDTFKEVCKEQTEQPILQTKDEEINKPISKPKPTPAVEANKNVETKIDIKNIPDKAKKLIPQTSLFEFIVEKGLFDENIDYYVYHDIKEINFGRFEEAKIDTDRLLVYQLNKFYENNKYIHFQRWDYDYKWIDDEFLMKEREIVIKYLVRKYVDKWDEKSKHRRMYFDMSFSEKYRNDRFLMKYYYIPFVEVLSSDDIRRCYSLDMDTLYGDTLYMKNLKDKHKGYEKFI